MVCVYGGSRINWTMRQQSVSGGGDDDKCNDGKVACNTRDENRDWLWVFARAPSRPHRQSHSHSHRQCTRRTGLTSGPHWINRRQTHISILHMRLIVNKCHFRRFVATSVCDAIAIVQSTHFENFEWLLIMMMIFELCSWHNHTWHNPRWRTESLSLSLWHAVACIYIGGGPFVCRWFKSRYHGYIYICLQRAMTVSCLVVGGWPRWHSQRVRMTRIQREWLRRHCAFSTGAWKRQAFYGRAG